jgi:hypothetical protein
VRGAKQLINRISNAGATKHFAAECEIIFTLIGKPHQVEAIMANFENRPAKFEDVGSGRKLILGYQFCSVTFWSPSLARAP